MSFFKDLIYLLMRDTEREAETQAEREKQAPCRERDMGLDPGYPGSRPRLKAVLNWRATGTAQYSKIKSLYLEKFNLCTLFTFPNKVLFKISQIICYWKLSNLSAILEGQDNWPERASHMCFIGPVSELIIGSSRMATKSFQQKWKGF